MLLSLSNTLLINTGLVVTTILFLLLSILCRLVTGIYLNLLIRETGNMAITENRFLLQCKTRFRNSYRLNDGIPNIPVFVERLLEKVCVGRFPVNSLSHLAGQLMLLSVVTAGLGACAAIASGRSAAEILPYYLLCFLCLYAFFSVSSLVNMEAKLERLKTNLTDYLENHMAPRLALLSEAELIEAIPEEEQRGSGSRQKEADQTITERYTSTQMFSTAQEKELEELLKEFFA